jgi:hypothetical protein
VPSARRQRDLFENSPKPIEISTEVQERTLKLLTELLTEALIDSRAEAKRGTIEDDDEQNHN